MTRAMVSLVTVVWLILGLGGAPAQAQQPPVRLSDRVVTSFVVRDINRLDALLRLGQAYRIPLGVEYVDQEAVTVRISVSVTNGTVGAVLDGILPHSQGYKWEEQEGVIVVSHRRVPRGKKNLLNTRIPRFDARPATIQELNNQVRLQLELVINPDMGGFAGSFPSGSTQDKIGPLRAHDKTVRELLNLLVSSAGGAAWIVQAPVEHMQTAPPQGLWGIVSYETPAKPLAELCCVRLDAFQKSTKPGAARHLSNH